MAAAARGSGLDPSETQGALRDAVASLQNLYALLRSSKVGPKAIAAVLPEIRQQLGPLAGEVEALLGEGEAERELASFAREQLDQAASAVERAEGSELDAKARLSLEASVARQTPVIDATRGLVDLMLAAHEQPIEVDVTELLEESLGASSQRIPLGGTLLTVMLELPKRGCCQTLVSPRVAGALCQLAMAHAGQAAGKGQVLQLTASKQAVAGGDLAVISVKPGAKGGRGDALSVRPPLLVAPTAVVVARVAELCGARARLEPGKPEARVELPPAEGETSTGRVG